MPEHLDQQVANALRTYSDPTVPVDALARIDRRIAQRRNRRRATIAGAACLGVIAAGGAAVATGGDRTDSDDLTASDTTGNYDLASRRTQVRMLRADGSPWTITDTEVRCAADPNGGPSQILEVQSRRVLRDGVPSDPLFRMTVSEQVETPITVEVPTTTETLDATGLFMFAALDQPPAGIEGPNEASSQADGATGYVTVHSVSCDGGPSINADLDVQLGSEVGLGAIIVNGTIAE